MIKTTQLELSPREFERFYAKQIDRGADSFRKKHLLGIIKSFTFGIGGVLFILSSSVQFNLVPIGMTSFLFGCYYFYIWAKLYTSFKKTRQDIESELNMCLAKYTEDDLIKISIDTENILYLDNSELINSTHWQLLTEMSNEENQLSRLLSKMEQLLKLRSFEVGGIFYESFANQLKKGFRITT